MAINDALDPILRLLGNLALEADVVTRNQLRAQAIPLVLKTAAEFIGPDRARACWFKLEAGPPARLVPTDFAGRAGSPTTTFVAGTPAGDAAIGMVLADEDRLCEDIVADPPPGWDSTKDRDTARSSRFRSSPETPPTGCSPSTLSKPATSTRTTKVSYG